jgi:uncharacterized protein
MPREHLPFWSFFHDIEKALSYERWIDKYKLFLETLLRKDILYDKDHVQFIQFCKALYLQDHRDEERFVQLLMKAIDQERKWLRANLRTDPDPVPADRSAASSKRPDNEPASRKNEQQERSKEKTTWNEKGRPEHDPEEDEQEEAPGIGEHKSMYYNPSFNTVTTPNKSDTSGQAVDFLYSDEYYSVTRRQMVKGWQFLRRQEKGGKANEFDLPLTITQIARDGLFLEPKFKSGLRNREDAIIIFADYRGSMVAFHELTDRLIATAKGEGGHPMAPVFYFQNYPAGYLYKQSNLTEPVKIRQALAKANRNFTMAIVISDAGAARTNRDPQEGSDRAAKTDFLLKHLKDTCAYTIWLNPMPLHRWKGTAAEKIRGKVFLMAPILEQQSYNFQDILRTILKQRLQTETKK